MCARTIHSSVLATQEIPREAQMDLAKYRRDRFARIRRISRSGGVLRVHSRSPIPRTHAYFEGFSARSENRETGWRRELDSNCRYRLLERLVMLTVRLLNGAGPK